MPESKNKRKTSPILIRIYLLLCVVVLAIGAWAWDKTAMTSPPLSYTDFSQGWTDENGNAFDLSKIEKSVTVYKQIPNLDYDVELFFCAQNIKAWVYVNGNLVSDSETEYSIADKLHYKAPGAHYIWTTLYREQSNGTIALKIEKTYRESDSSCNVNNMVIGNGHDILLSHIRSKAGSYSLCLMCVMLGLLLLIFSVPLRNYSKNGNSILYLGLFATVVGIWSMTETSWCQIIWGYSSFFHIITSFTLLLIAVPIYLFFRSRCDTVSNTSTYIISIITIISFALSFVMHFFFNKDIHELLILGHMSLCVCIVFLLYYAIKYLISVKFKDSAFWGLILLIVFATIDLLLYYREPGRDNATFTRLGLFIYIMILIYYVVRQYISVYNESVEIEILRKLAFIDVLTGFENRVAWTEKLKAIENDREKYQDSLIMVFDVNCLKYINDTYGHSMGDKSIAESSEYIKQHFGKSGICYRIGGDEFVLLADKTVTDNDISEKMKEFEKGIETRNEVKHKDYPYPLYIASGKARIDFTDGKDASDAFNIADKEMYDNKLELKRRMPEFDIRGEGK